MVRQLPVRGARTDDELVFQAPSSEAAHRSPRLQSWDARLPTQNDLLGDTGKLSGSFLHDSRFFEALSS